MTQEQAVVFLFLVGSVISMAAGALWLRDRFCKHGTPPQSPKASDLPYLEQRRLRRVFWRRRNLAIAGFFLPFLLWAVGAVFAKRLQDVHFFGTSLLAAGAGATLAAWCFNLLFILVFMRCPLCGRGQLSLMNEGDSFYNGGQKSQGLDMSPDSCRHCGLNLREP